MPPKKYHQNIISSFKNSIFSEYREDIVNTVAQLLHDNGAMTDPLPENKEGYVLQAMRTGAFRDGDGRKFPFDWDFTDLYLYMLEKENPDAFNAAYNSYGNPDNPIHDPNDIVVNSTAENSKPDRMFLIGIKDPNTQETVFKGVKPYFTQYVLDCKTNKEGAWERLNAAGNMPSASVTDATLEIIPEKTVNSIRDAIGDLWIDLNKRDTIFSSGSREYQNLYKALKAFNRRLSDPNNQFLSADDFEDLLKPNGMEKSVFDYALDYQKSKASLAQKETLSDRQIDRLSMCARLGKIKELIAGARNDGAKDFTKEINANKAACKAAFENMKATGSLAARRMAYLSDFRKSHIETIEKALMTKSDKYVETLSSKSSSGVLKALSSEKTPKQKKHSKEELAQAKDAIIKIDSKEQSMVSVAQYLLDRTAGMMKELKANDSFFHSSEYKKFSDAVENLHEAVIGIAVKKDFGRKILSDALKDVTMAAVAYQEKHLGEKATEVSTKVINRLGIAEELRICDEFMSDPAQKNPDELFLRINDHQDLMRDLLQSKKAYDKSVSRGMTSDFTDANYDPDRDNKLNSDREKFSRSFNKLLSSSTCQKEHKLPENEKERRTLIMAATDNISKTKTRAYVGADMNLKDILGEKSNKWLKPLTSDEDFIPKID